MSECNLQQCREENSLSSDDTEFMDLPLPPLPARAVEIHTVDTNPSMSAFLFSRMDEFDVAPCESSESSSTDSENDISTPQNESKWSSSDEESSFYRDKLSCLRSNSSTPNAYLDDNLPNLFNGSLKKGKLNQCTFKRVLSFSFNSINIRNLLSLIINIYVVCI